MIEFLLDKLGLRYSTPLRPFLLGFLLTSILSVVLLLLILLVIRDPASFGEVGTIAPLCVLVLFLCLYVINRSYSPEINRILAGNYWARWEYDQQTWANFSEDEWERARSRSRKYLLISIGLGAVGVVVMALSATATPLSWLLILYFLGTITLAFPLGIALDGLLLYRQRRGQPGEVQITGSGFLRSPNEYVAFNDFGRRLMRVEHDATQYDVVHFTTLVYSSEGSYRQTINLSVPPGHQKDVEKLIEDFKRPLNEQDPFFKEQVARRARASLWAAAVMVIGLVVGIPLISSVMHAPIQAHEDATSTSYAQTSQVTLVLEGQTATARIQTIQTEASAQLTQIRSALNPFMAQWRKTAPKDSFNLVYPASLGLGGNTIIREVYYGLCEPYDKFVVYVFTTLNRIDPATQESASGQTEACANIPRLTPYICTPANMHLEGSKSISLDGDWYYVILETKPATTIPQLTASASRGLP
jgi:hypothetical protein